MTIMCKKRALVVVITAHAAARVTKVACTIKRSGRVAASRVAMTVVREQRALVDVAAAHTATRITQVACTGKGPN